MIAVSVADELGESKFPASKRRWTFAVVMSSLCLGTSLLGFVAVKLAAPIRMPICCAICRPSKMSSITCPEATSSFLRSFKESGLFNRGRDPEMLLDRALSDRWRPVAWSLGMAILVVAGFVAAGESWADRRARIERMSPAEKDQLLRQQQRFLQLAPTEQLRLRSFATELEKAPDAAELRQVLDQYCQWLLTLPVLERAGSYCRWSPTIGCSGSSR